MLPSLKPLLLVSGLLLGAAPHLLAGMPDQQPAHRAFPHFRAPEKRKPKHYKPKTWREKASTPKPPPAW